uniref:Uncharacterized protein n=1 Tax=Rhizophora mucronata TaxID=61149 RepID=A0A2P2II04_RHIMU
MAGTTVRLIVLKSAPISLQRLLNLRSTNYILSCFYYIAMRV